MSMKEVTDDAVKKYLELYFLTGEVQNQETLSRYIRDARGRFPEWLSFMQTTKELRSKFTPEELRQIANAERIIPTRTKSIRFDGEVYRFAHITDTHMGASCFHEDTWDAMVEEMNSQNLDAVFHTGDITDGLSTKRMDAVYDLTHIGYKQQKDYSIELLSRIKAPIYAIGGNHDRFYLKSSGALIAEDIAKEVDGMQYLGEDMADFVIENGERPIKIRLWHGEDGSCFDDMTEILTSDGWKYFKDLVLDDEVATMTKDDMEFQWQKPSNIFVKDYDGDMIHFKSRTVDCMVTPNHNMWTRVSHGAVYRRLEEMTMPQKSHIRLNTDWHMKTAGDLYNEYSRQKWQFTKHCIGWVGNTPEYVTIPYRESKNKGVKVHHFGEMTIDDAAELIAWYVTEGYVMRNSMNISQYKSVNPENHAQIVRLADRLGMNYAVHDKYITFHSTELCEWIVNECGAKSRHVHLPKWLKDCGTDILNLVIDTMIAGDGWDSGTESSYGYRSISNQLVADFGEIAVKCGYSVTYYGDGETVGITKCQTEPTVNALPDVLNYKGKIYCCEVPNGLIYVRRNGVTLWTHNSYATSYRVQKLVESFSGGDKPNVLLCGHTHKQMFMMERNIECLSGGAVCYQSNWMRSKRLANHTGFWIVEMTFNERGIAKFSPTWYPFY